MHSKSSHHKKHKKDKKKHKHKSRHSDESSRHHHKKRKRKHAEAAEGSAAADVIYIDDGAHSVKQLRLDDDNSLQVTYVTILIFRAIDALNILPAQLMCDLFAIAKFLFAFTDKCSCVYESM